MEIRFYIDPETEQPHIYRHNVDEQDVEAVLARPLEDRPGRGGAHVALGQTRTGCYVREEELMSNSCFPPGWDEQRVRRLLDYYEQQPDVEAVAEDEAAYESITETMMAVPVELVPRVRELIAAYRGE